MICIIALYDTVTHPFYTDNKEDNRYFKLDTYAHKSKGFYSPYPWLIVLNIYDLLLFLTGKTRLNVIFIRCFIIFYKNVCFFIFLLNLSK
jgi:hypothetical protein